MENIYAKSLFIVLVILQIGSILSIPIVQQGQDSSNLDNIHSLMKRGGARAFYGFSNTPNSKRDNLAALPYYLYDKRGGGRAFNHNSDLLYRFDKRGGGRAFAGSWSPYLERFYDYKRSGYPVYFSDSPYF